MTEQNQTNRTHWLNEEKKLDDRFNEALWPGGQKAVDRLAKHGKKPVRDLIDQLIDPGTEFFELSRIAGFGMDYPGVEDVPCAGVVTGLGKIYGNWTMIFANDSRVKAGTYFPITLKKHMRAQAIAEENGLNCVYIADSGGAFLPMQADVFPDDQHFGAVDGPRAVGDEAPTRADDEEGDAGERHREREERFGAEEVRRERRPPREDERAERRERGPARRLPAVAVVAPRVDGLAVVDLRAAAEEVAHPHREPVGEQVCDAEDDDDGGVERRACDAGDDGERRHDAVVRAVHGLREVAPRVSHVVAEEAFDHRSVGRGSVPAITPPSTTPGAWSGRRGPAGRTRSSPRGTAARTRREAGGRPG